MMALPTSLQVRAGDPNKPLVLLLHGHEGTVLDMADPASRPEDKRYHFDFRAPLGPDRDLGWSWYPHVGPYDFHGDRMRSFDPSVPGSIKSWKNALTDGGYGTAVYSQLDPVGPLARPVQELAEVVAHLRTTYPRIVLLGHSRGGLLIRKFLKVNAGNPGLVGPISAAITLHSPHNGTSLLTAVTAVSNILNTLMSHPAPQVRDIFNRGLGWLRSLVNSSSLSEMAPGSAFLRDLEAGERAVPGVAYATFGGTSVAFARVKSWSYTPESALAQWRWPPYHVVIRESVVWPSPIAHSQPIQQMVGSIPEWKQGVGDLLTTDGGARLPFAVHRTNHLNHAEAMWDPSLQQQVLSILEGIRPEGSVVREASAAPVFVLFGGAKFWIPSPAVLEKYGGWGAVRVVPDGALTAVPVVPRDGTVLREMSSAPVYVMTGGQKHWIPNPTILQKYGGWGAVRVVPDGALAGFPQGPNAS